MLTQTQGIEGNTQPKRKRKFKIFQPLTKPHSQLLVSSLPFPNQSLPNPSSPPQEEPPHRQKQLVKLSPKEALEHEFYSGAGEQQQFEMLDVCIDQYSSSEGRFMDSTPSFMFRNHELTINEEGLLYHSVQEIKHHYQDIESECQAVRAEVGVLEGSVRGMEAGEEEKRGKLREVEEMLEKVQAENEEYQRKLKEISLRIEAIEYLIDLQARGELSLKQSEGSTMKGQQTPQFDQFIFPLKQEEEQDEFAESHYLPAGLITQYLKERQIQREQQQALRRMEEQSSHAKLSIFHPIFRIGQHQYECLLSFILEELPHLKAERTGLRLLFRRGTTEVQREWVGSKGELEYKENLVFLVKTSTGKRIGGFISADLIEEETMADPHAFLFTLEEGCCKFRVKEECCGEAFMASRHYLVTFGSDLMISSNCLEEENYCEWPSSYAPRDQASFNTWLAGDFWFMIEHIEVYQVVEEGAV